MKPTIESGPPHFKWPVIDEVVVEAVRRQMIESVSIYDRSGIFKRFEDRFASDHNRTHGLVFNSGTSALHAAYYAINVLSGDEVICADYGFFASVCPLNLLGGVGVLCEIDPSGGVSVDDVERSITRKTKAIVVTHLWGVPAEIEALRRLCDSHGLYLIEDCSHAHYAEFGGRKVGEFGHIAAWSLQAQKLISAGEGGIALTDDTDLFERMLLLGHYNKRCRQQILQTSSNYQFATTGHGLKLRAHPLGIAMAEVDLDRISERLTYKRQNAAKMTEQLQQYSDKLSLPVVLNRSPSWYAYSFCFRSGDRELARRIHGELIAQGAEDFDMPSSTTTISTFPLFRDWRLSPGRTGSLQNCQNIVEGYADRFAKTSIKVSVPWEESQGALWEQYISVLCDVLDRNLRRS